MDSHRQSAYSRLIKSDSRLWVLLESNWVRLPAGLEAQGRIAESPLVRYEYNPHLSPAPRFSNDPAKADQLPDLLQIAHQRPLSDPEIRMLADALRRHEPWLEWAGKREKPWFEADPMPLHIHERVSTQAILRVLAREEVQRSLFADPELEHHQAVRFYLHDGWARGT